MSAGKARQRGLSLVELMIAMVLGLVIVAAVFNAYASSRRSAQFTAGLQSMQENGRYGVSVLQKGLRLAGYSPAGELAPIDLATSTDERIVVRLRQGWDCNGVDTAARGGVAENTYAYDAAARRITCTGDSSPTAEPMSIVDDVDGFRLLYGVDEDGDCVPERYVPHATLGVTGDPDSVAALRFALLVGSGVPIRTRAWPETHVLLDRVVDTNDAVARTVFASTVKLRNSRSECPA